LLEGRRKEGRRKEKEGGNWNHGLIRCLLKKPMDDQVQTPSKITFCSTGPLASSTPCVHISLQTGSVGTSLESNAAEWQVVKMGYRPPCSREPEAGAGSEC
jgi:hypothetical protein